jgi:hypothetical protein
MRFALVSIAALTISGAAQAQNNTKFTPDIVMDCIETKTSKPSSRCVYQCFSIPRPTDGPISIWPPIAWVFERLEFFSKPGRESENWLVSVNGRPQSSAITRNSKFFITIGTAFLCTYTEGPEIVGGQPTEVRLTKYY